MRGKARVSNKTLFEANKPTTENREMEKEIVSQRGIFQKCPKTAGQGRE